MKAAVCYYSRHHGNTLKVLEAMAQGNDLELIDVTSCTAADLTPYDVVGFASGVYYGKFHESVVNFARQCLPSGKKVFFIYTCGAQRGGYTKAIAQAANEKRTAIWGEYGCLGYDTFGPFKLIGGIAKGHPNAAELDGARKFYEQITEETP
jgi:flavodoxin